jgi:hypothetical protein
MYMRQFMQLLMAFVLFVPSAVTASNTMSGGNVTSDPVKAVTVADEVRTVIGTVYDAATGTMVANPNYDPYKVMAADLNGDGIIDAIDATIIGDASIFMFRINQVTGRPE